MRLALLTRSIITQAPISCFWKLYYSVCSLLWPFGIIVLACNPEIENKNQAYHNIVILKWRQCNLTMKNNYIWDLQSIIIQQQGEKDKWGVKYNNILFNILSNKIIIINKYQKSLIILYKYRTPKKILAIIIKSPLVLSITWPTILALLQQQKPN